MLMNLSYERKNLVMVMYKCLNCGKKFEIKDKVQCPYCGYRIAIKPRPRVAKLVVAR